MIASCLRSSILAKESAEIAESLVQVNEAWKQSIIFYVRWSKQLKRKV